MNNEVVLSREELYALVWSESFPGLAKRYCLSTEKLRKICIRLSIPVPRPHYWNRVRAGEAEEAIPFPANHRGDSTVTLQLAASEEQGREVSFSAIKEPLVVAVRNTLRRKMTVTNSLRDGLVRGDSSQLDVRVAPETIDRACLFMDAFIRRLREREQRREKEVKDVKDLLQEAQRWRQAVLLREYLNAVEREASAKGNLTPDLQDWLA